MGDGPVAMGDEDARAASVDNGSVADNMAEVSPTMFSVVLLAMDASCVNVEAAAAESTPAAE